MMSLEQIVYLNDLHSRPDKQVGDVFVVTKSEAADVYANYSACDDYTDFSRPPLFFSDPDHYYHCEPCRNRLLEYRKSQNESV